MRAEGYDRVFQIFEESLECEPDERTQHIQAASDDTAIVEEAIKLLHAHERVLEEGFLEEPFGLNGIKLSDEVFDAISQPLKLKQIGSYQIVEEIGRGGMSVVFRATQANPARSVALKVFVDRALDDPTQVQRFHKEANAIAQLSHPGIVQVFEAGEDDGYHFLAMELVEGSELCTLASLGQTDSAEAASLIASVAEAIQFAHQNGVVHRDIKPHNILLNATGQPLVADFGLAKHIGETNHLTASGTIVGTPSYMPPEQIAGNKDANPASDIYGLGATLYFLLTGQPPFNADSTIETIRQVADEPPKPPRLLNSNVPKNLETICLKCLSKEPIKRYVSAAHLADDLNRWLNNRPIHARPVNVAERLALWTRRNRIGVFLSVTLLTVVVAGSLISSWRQTVAEATMLANSVPTANLLGLAPIVDGLNANRDIVNPVLHDLLDEHKGIPDRLLNLQLALMPSDDAIVEQLVSALLSRKLSDLIPICHLLRRHKQDQRMIKLLIPIAGEAASVLILPDSQQVSANDSAEAKQQNELAKDEAAQKLVRVLGAMSLLGEPLKVEPYFVRSRDLRIRSLAIHNFPQFAIEADWVIERLTTGNSLTPDVKAAYIQMLGSLLTSRPAIGPAKISGSKQDQKTKPELDGDFVRWLKETYSTDNDPEVHGSAGWLLRTLSLEAPELPTSDLIRDNRANWYHTKHGHQMVVVEPPSPDVVIHQARVSKSLKAYPITTSFAISAFPETIGQFREFEQRPEWESKSGSELLSPVDHVEHDTILKYCNWLTRRSGLPESEQCFLIRNETAEPVNDFRRKRGFRLATQEEWEYACRGGTTTVRYYGHSLDLLPHYEWFRDDSPAGLNGGDLINVGKLKPNPLGLFDMMGNVYELCQDSYIHGATLPISDQDRFNVDTTDRIFRSSSRRADAAKLSCESGSFARVKQPNKRGVSHMGFRVVQTILPQ
jgi:serine/threonine protein kinase/formylglycine-generating enzyme required for sulfatase activity